MEMTHEIVEVARRLGIAVHEHIVVWTGGHVSLAGLKLS
jgi:DNA repair protein RadC